MSSDAEEVPRDPRERGDRRAEIDAIIRHVLQKDAELLKKLGDA